MKGDVQMTKQITINSISELQAIQRLATAVQDDVYFHSLDNSIMVDAKSFIGLFTLDFSQPVLLVTENQYVLDNVDKIL